MERLFENHLHIPNPPWNGNGAEIRTRLVLCYLSWEPNMFADESEPRRLTLLKRQHELLTKK